MFKSVDNVKAAVDAGLPVKWASRSYDVIRDSIGQYLIKCNFNGYCMGLNAEYLDRIYIEKTV